MGWIEFAFFKKHQKREAKAVILSKKANSRFGNQTDQNDAKGNVCLLTSCACSWFPFFLSRVIATHAHTDSDCIYTSTSGAHSFVHVHVAAFPLTTFHWHPARGSPFLLDCKKNGIGHLGISFPNAKPLTRYPQPTTPKPPTWGALRS